MDILALIEAFLLPGAQLYLLQQMQVCPVPDTPATEPSQWHSPFDRHGASVAEASYHSLLP
jgi:hypothetical protein